MFSIQEIMTAVELGLGIPFVIVDNGGYDEIEDQMVERTISPFAVNLDRPDFAPLGQSMGGAGVTGGAPTSTRSMPACRRRGSGTNCSIRHDSSSPSGPEAPTSYPTDRHTNPERVDMDISSRHHLPRRHDRIRNLGARYKAKNQDDYLVAGRRLGGWLYTGTISAVVLGGASTIGGVGLGYTSGLSGMWLVFSIGLGIITALHCSSPPKIQRLEIYTVSQMLELRYGRGSRLVSGIIMTAYGLMISTTSTVAYATIFPCASRHR